jgi:hypothetical protein
MVNMNAKRYEIEIETAKGWTLCGFADSSTEAREVFDDKIHWPDFGHIVDRRVGPIYVYYGKKA